MAGCSNQCSKTKFSGFRKGPKLRSWIWCIVVQFTLTLPCLFSTRLEQDPVVIVPDRDINLVYGKPLEIFCIAEANYTSSDLKFTVGEETLDSEVVNSTTRRLYIENVERQVRTYYCRNVRSNKRDIRRVVVDTPPENVTDFKCISKNFESLRCSFRTPDLISNVQYNLTFSVNDNVVNPPCTAKRIDANTRYCEWNTVNTQPRYRQSEEQLYFNLHAKSDHFGSNNQTFIIDHYEIVKPDPPLGLKIVKNGSHSVTLEWKLPNNILDFLPCGVDHIIEYQIAKIDNRTHFHRVNATLPPKNQTYRYQLANLPYAHVQYEVRVYIKSKKAFATEFLSNFSYLVFYTLSEKPSRPPELVAGAFDHSTYFDRRILCVYWKQLEEYEESGTNFTYKVVTSQGNTTHTLFPDKSKSLGYIFLNTTLDAINVHVWSFNSKGSSANNSYLYIPPDKQTRLFTPKSFTKLAYENGTYELSWKLDEKIDNYTLFWCKHNASRSCSGRMDFTVLSPEKKKHVIDLPNQYRYQFAIAANYGTQSSGMVWELYCDISKDGYVMYGYPVRLSNGTPGKRSVTLNWEMNCAVVEGIILGYNISYCPIVETSSNCDPNFPKNHTYVGNPKYSSTTIRDLLPYKTYQFTLALKTIYGLKNIENATCQTTTSEDVPTKPINVKISDVKNDSLVIAWDPPLQRNGNIGKYVILNYDTEFYVDNVPGTDKSSRKVKLTGLQGFTNYSFAVKACNIPLNVCSEVKLNDYKFVRTRIGPPGRLKAPNVKNSGEITWEKPEHPGGTLDRYQIRRVKDEYEAEIYNSTDLTYNLHQCESGVSSETYEVRAINFDEDLYHGVILIDDVDPPKRTNETEMNEYPGEWSEPSTVACRGNSGLAIISIFAGIFAAVGVAYGSIKIYKSYRKMEDIKPVLPHGLGEPEKDISKYTFGNWNPNNKEEKPSSDEMLLLPNSKSVTTSSDVKQKDSNGDTSDQTDSTALSDSSKGTIDRQASTSDDGSDSSLNLEIEPIKMKNDKEEDDEASSAIDTASSCENSPYLSNETFKKTPTSGYIQQPVVNAKTGYVPAQLPVKNTPPVVSPQPASSSYVMASLPPTSFSGGAPPIIPNPKSSATGYVMREEPQANLMLGKQTQKTLGADTLPNTPSLSPAAKMGADSSYMQLHSLDSLPSFKPSIRNAVPMKPAASGYVSPTDHVINKHLNNILTAGQLTEESAILDPSMSPDAYCRFSWSTDPANDNLHSLLADSPSRTSKN
ncbi:cytokine receptor [Aricia agestis]|uniref:cytokine receptor n=1 Tax=Aricia agestis TaxID=91739 RepID=UPI001C201C24|nr:cytokine receptor [Aricia agestis]